MSYDKKFDASLDLLRRLNPQKVSAHLNDICTIVNDEELTQDLLSSVDVPLESRTCPDTGKEFLCCDYNRDGDSYRSPWSNKYVPAPSVNEDDPPPFPSDSLRQLETKANESFDIYRDLYYEGSGISSVYLWDTEDEETLDSFAGVVLLKKQTDDKSGSWDSIHVFEVIAEGSGSALYKVTSSVILDLSKTNLNLSGSLTRQLEQSSAFGSVNLETSHLVNLGTLIEKSEYNLRNLLQDVYFDKLKDIVMKDLRSDVSSQREDDERQSEVIKSLKEL
ncbi:F-actin-capping protein subunit beta [[Candida] railenensis]|uniref:F-actin-capping protein subunit beta n=1 Tax=[Candida] railenensis TaxID=45579 RepID=A0A9P0QSY7_9ASCO|nr:F-actin-capping protein subunit beta [[Candida] railenensis]